MFLRKFLSFFFFFPLNLFIFYILSHRYYSIIYPYDTTYIPCPKSTGRKTFCTEDSMKSTHTRLHHPQSEGKANEGAKKEAKYQRNFTE